jgi:hypothetical protein
MYSVERFDDDETQRIEQRPRYQARQVFKKFPEFYGTRS